MDSARYLGLDDIKLSPGRKNVRFTRIKRNPALNYCKYYCKVLQLAMTKVIFSCENNIRLNTGFDETRGALCGNSRNSIWNI